MTALSAGQVPAEHMPLRRNRGFLALWSGQIVSTLGTAGSSTALPLLVLATTGSATDAGLIGAATALPALLIQLPAGALVDRWNRLRVMTVCETVTGLALLAIPAALMLGHLALLIVSTAVIVQRCCAVFFGSAEHAALPVIVPAAQLGDAIAQNEAKSRAAGLLGPPLGGALFGFGRALPFVADALSSLAAAGALLFVRADLRPARSAASQSLRRETAQGLGWIWSHRHRELDLGRTAAVVPPHRGSFAARHDRRGQRVRRPDLECRDRLLPHHSRPRRAQRARDQRRDDRHRRHDPPGLRRSRLSPHCYGPDRHHHVDHDPHARHRDHRHPQPGHPQRSEGVRVRAIEPDAIAAWCERHLGSAPVETVFAKGNLSRVLGLRLADGREVVVKIRPSEARQEGCTAVQRHLWQAGFPCPEPLAGPAPLDGTAFAVNAEALISGGTPYPSGDGSARARAFAELLVRLVAEAPAPGQVPDLAPPPAWIDWDHSFPALWPPADDRDVDLNALPETLWLDRYGRAARDRLTTTRAAFPVIGHCDWESHNLDFRDGELLAVHDWDSVVCAAETVICGVAAAMWPAGVGCAGASLEQSEDFVDAYQRARGRSFSGEEIEETWAAGLWVRSFNAKKFLLDGFETLAPAEAEERLRRAAAL